MNKVYVVHHHYTIEDEELKMDERVKDILGVFSSVEAAKQSIGSDADWESLEYLECADAWTAIDTTGYEEDVPIANPFYSIMGWTVQE